MECMGCVGLQISPSHLGTETRKEGNVLFNDVLNTFYLWLYGIGHIVKEGRKEMFYLTMHSTHFICGHMASDIL